MYTVHDQKNEGNYSCRATNIAGTDTTFYEVLLKSKLTNISSSDSISIILQPEDNNQKCCYRTSKI